MNILSRYLVQLPDNKNISIYLLLLLVIAEIALNINNLSFE